MREMGMNMDVINKMQESGEVGELEALYEQVQTELGMDIPKGKNPNADQMKVWRARLPPCACLPLLRAPADGGCPLRRRLSWRTRASKRAWRTSWGRWG